MLLTNYDKLFRDLGINDKGDIYKFTALYGYYVINDGREDESQDALDGVVTDRGYDTMVDGLFLNPRTDEDALDVVTVYLPDSKGFDPAELKNQIRSAYLFIKDFFVGIKTHGHKEAENRLYDLIDDYVHTTVPVLITAIINCSVSDKERTDLTTSLNTMGMRIRGFDVTLQLLFSVDFEGEIENSKEPFEYVKDNYLEIDAPNNISTYRDNAFLCNVSARSLKKLWKAEGKRGLLAMNLRYYVKQANVDSGITSSIIFDYENFWYMNNGIIIVCNDFSFDGKKLRLKEFSIVNGGQTTSRIGETEFENDFYITCKVVKNVLEGTEKLEFISKVAEASNTQKPIKAKDTLANKVEQRELKERLAKIGIFVEVKRGDKPRAGQYPESWQKTKNNEIGQDLYSFVFQEPGPARNNLSKILINPDKYDLIFKKHSYTDSFYRSLIWLEKAYLKYKKNIIKSDSIDPTFKGVVKNGMYYTIAFFGLCLKLKYNPRFVDLIDKYTFNSDRVEKAYKELAFDHGFIDESLSFDEFYKKIVPVFDYALNQYIVKEFAEERLEHPDLAYSNWTKTNTGFRKFAGKFADGFAKGQNTIPLQILTKIFSNISQVQTEKNVELFKKLLGLSGYIDDENKEVKVLDPQKLYFDLMTFRMTESQAKHVRENIIFTDDQISLIVQKIPLTKSDLGKIINQNTVHFCGDRIIDIIKRNL